MVEINLADGTSVKAYPISASQQMMYLMSLKYGSGYPVNNIGMGYYWKGEMDKDIMKEAVYEAVSRCDTMRLRFTMGKKLKLLQYVTEKSELKVEEWNYTHLTVEKAQGQLTAFSRTNIPMFNCELHRIALIDFAEGYTGIFMRIHHLAMDAYSLKIFLNDIFEIYLHKTKGTPYPKPMRPYIPALEKDLSYETSEHNKIDREYWFDSLAKYSEPIFTDFMLENRLKAQQQKNPSQRYADIHSGLPDASAVKFSMSAERSEAFLEMCSKNDLSVFSAVSMAVRTGLSCLNDNQQDVSFKMIINCRGTVEEKKSGGLRINFLPMRSIITPDESFKEGVNKISEIQSEMYLHSKLAFLDVLKERHKSMPKKAKFDSTYDSFGLSYQPPLKITAIASEAESTVKSIWYNNGATMIPLYVTVLHRAYDGGLDFIFEYRKEPECEYDLRILYSKIEKIMIIGTENPDITVGEILNNISLTDEERRGKPECVQSKNLLKSLKTSWKLTKSRAKTILSLISA
ncbi:MAG: hypothetical protein IKK60_00870 [Clostridia bacterium]|nr:hypothetical protein [Clostridia bacterium]